MNLVIDRPLPEIWTTRLLPSPRPRPWSAALKSTIPVGLGSPRRRIRRQLIPVPPFPIPACP